MTTKKAQDESSAEIVRLDHLGIAVDDLEQALQVFHHVLGIPVIHRERLESYGIDVVSLQAGEVVLELMQPFQEKCAVSEYLRKKGAGVQHICFSVRNLQSALRKLEERGFTLIDREPRTGAGGHKVAFIHPRSTSRILLELTEKSGV
jgi:methylmalonyl-CoA/ethylmalonyl-CoA epimerase